jgi:hypothetical protein
LATNDEKNTTSRQSYARARVTTWMHPTPPTTAETMRPQLQRALGSDPSIKCDDGYGPHSNASRARRIALHHPFGFRSSLSSTSSTPTISTSTSTITSTSSSSSPSLRLPLLLVGDGSIMNGCDAYRMYTMNSGYSCDGSFFSHPSLGLLRKPTPNKHDEIKHHLLLNYYSVVYHHYH